MHTVDAHLERMLTMTGNQLPFRSPNQTTRGHTHTTLYNTFTRGAHMLADIPVRTRVTECDLLPGTESEDLRLLLRVLLFSMLLLLLALLLLFDSTAAILVICTTCCWLSTGYPVDVVRSPTLAPNPPGLTSAPGLCD